MKNVESLKHRAREYEQREDWRTALEFYQRAIELLEQEDRPDIGLHNRVGDLQVRLGEVDGAVVNYERAVDLYLEAELPNNAIAVCKKVLRNLPTQYQIFLLMARIRAHQGFVPDARENFLTYAGLMQQAGRPGDALDALLELSALTPRDLELALSLGEQLVGHDRESEAVRLYHRTLTNLEDVSSDEELATLRERIRGLDPDGSISEGLAGDVEIVGTELSEREDPVPRPLGSVDDGFLEPQTVDFDEPASHTAVGDRQGETQDEEGSDDDVDVFFGEDPEEYGRPKLSHGLSEGDESSAESVEASFDEGEEDVDEVEPEDERFVEGQSDDGESEEDESQSGAELFLLARSLVDEGRSDEGRLGFERAYAGLVDEGEDEEAFRCLEAWLSIDEDRVDLRQRMVEHALRSDDTDTIVTAYLELGDCLLRTGDGGRAHGVFRQVMLLAPENDEVRQRLTELDEFVQREEAGAVQVASSEDYVDLGAMIFDGEKEKTTRWVVAAEEPSGDEEADFAKMLDQFKHKVAEHVAADDFRAHYDLGTAYKEMGLLDEAIGEFQQALRASPDHLPTYELLGQCFIEKGQHQIAIKSLERALRLPNPVEDELLGIYYYLGRSHETLGEPDAARGFYERIFSLDINFEDVTERLRKLR